MSFLFKVSGREPKYASTLYAMQKHFVSQCGPVFVCIRFNCTNIVMLGARKNMKLLSCMFAGGTAR